MNELDKYDPRHWKWELIYYNPHDPKLIVKRRIGWGYTLNLAHRATWIFLIIIMVAIAIAVMVFKR
jgi:uncharacterized membrane protein